MIDKLPKNDCTGCFACLQRCPQGCISKKKNAEGFLAPWIDLAACTQCNACEAACPVLSPVPRHACLSAYAARNKDEVSLMQSTSGGVFPVLAQRTLQGGGVVFGVCMEADGMVKTIGITDAAELPRLQGSKYVQSDVGNSYMEAKKILRMNKPVLFTGTPCQIAGLYGYLGKDDANLLTVELVCHGVPSQELFSKVWQWLESRQRQKLVRWVFRSKKTEGWAQIDELCFTHSVQYRREMLSPYARAYLQGKLNRESCYRCRFACEERIADITLGDYWGIAKVHPEFDARRGASLILANTDKGIQSVKAAQNHMVLVPSALKDMQRYNGNLKSPPHRPPQRDTVYLHLHEKAMHRFMREDLKVPLDMKERLKQWIPYRTRQRVKRVLHTLHVRSNGNEART